MAELEYIFCLMEKQSPIAIPHCTSHAPMHKMGRSNFRPASAAASLQCSCNCTSYTTAPYSHSVYCSTLSGVATAADSSLCRSVSVGCRCC